MCSLNRWFHFTFSDLSFLSKIVRTCVRVHCANIQIDKDEIQIIFIGIELVVKSGPHWFENHFANNFFYIKSSIFFNGFFMFSSCAFNLFSIFTNYLGIEFISYVFFSFAFLSYIENRVPITKTDGREKLKKKTRKKILYAIHSLQYSIEKLTRTYEHIKRGIVSRRKTTNIQ